MSKTIYLIVLFLLISWIIFITWPRNFKNTLQKIAGKDFNLEIANNPTLQAKGLSNRQSLCSYCGMLFVFQNQRIQTFWMKDTLIPLDMIFINKDFVITDIFTAYPEPGVKDFKLKLYQSSSPSLYIIELNAGQAQKLGLKVGDTLKLNI